MSAEKGLVVVLTGGGKGKTTSALGMALRAAGHEMNVCFISFMKGTIHTGEMESIKRLAPHIELHRVGKGFFREHDRDKHAEAAMDGIRLAREKAMSGNYGVLVLDEINNALSHGLIPVGDVISLIKERPEGLHIILTGRNAPPEIIELADTVTEMKEVKHAYQKGEKPRKGIDV